jgi:hypothetical protein
VANPWAVDRPAGGWPPEGHIIITSWRLKVIVLDHCRSLLKGMAWRAQVKLKEDYGHPVPYAYAATT